MTYVNKTLESPETLALARSLFTYDPKRGLLLWKPSATKRLAARRPAGKPAGSINKDGYRVVSMRKRPYSAHRVIWAMVHGRWPADLIDHKDLNRANNRLENLREANLSQQGANAPGKKKGLKGTILDRRNGRWMAKIIINRKQKHIGCYATEQEAHAAYLKAAKATWGEFARG